MRSNKFLIGGVLLFFAAASASDQPGTFVHKKKYVMGTVFEIVAYDSSVARASLAVDRALDEIVRLDAVMSNFKQDSELSRLNRTAKFRAQTVSTDLYAVIEQALEYSRISGGSFDISVGPLVDLWKAAMVSNTAPSAAQEAQARACVGYEHIRLTAPNQVMFESSCLRLDLGGIGKGYAVDRAANILRTSGINAALIDAGGSTIYAMGSPPGQAAWLVHMRDPSRQIDPTVMLSDQSISTSEQSPPSLLASSSAGHIIDPPTGVPLKTRFAVSVIAKTGVASDALSTTLLLAGPDAGQRMVEKIPGSAAIWIAPDGESHTVSMGPKILVRGPLHSGRQSRGSGTWGL